MGLHREEDSPFRSRIAVPAVWQLLALVLLTPPAFGQGDPRGPIGYYLLGDAGPHAAASVEGPGYSREHPYPQQHVSPRPYRGVEEAVACPGAADRQEPCPWQWDVDCLARGYYLNDQRIEWSGVEATFGAEAVLAPVLVHRSGEWETTVRGEFYLNQPFDRNILVDTAERASYAANWDVDPFEISQLSLEIRRGDLALAVGKMPTPFGRTYFPLLSNARLDAPFIRTESILWRETGVLFRYQPGWLVADLGLTNGGDDRDANSSKALVWRLGIEGHKWAAGASVKIQDGIGSEQQKMYKNHIGIDFMIRRGRLVLSGEAIYDEYGFRRPGFDPLDITWGRSIYFRDQNYRSEVPVTGIGYYIDLGYEGRRWRGSIDYGEFYPQQLGDPRHDVPKRRGIVKLIYHLTSHLSSYAVVMVENGGYLAQDDRPREGLVVLAGLEWAL